ncbi:MAG: hypothetical protein J7647_24440 [Cyanobacteria bacterium SBLK]|nr:hypothetical protein [Cyanobacteria bacterium SBLK]
MIVEKLFYFDRRDREKHTPKDGQPYKSIDGNFTKPLIFPRLMYFF